VTLKRAGYKPEMVAAAWLAAILTFAWTTKAPAQSPPASPLPILSAHARPAPLRASTSRAAQQEAIESIPLDRLDPAARAKVSAVLANVSIFRRLPVEVIPCDSELYLFLLDHPDVVVNIWQVLGISRVTLHQAADGAFQVADDAGTTGSIQLLYRDQHTHVFYTEGQYNGPVFGNPIHGQVLIVMKSGYVQRPDGRCYITCRLDAFTHIDNVGVEIITKTIQPLIGKTADANFMQTAAFIGTLSRTAEVNHAGIQRLARKLALVQPEVRDQFAQITQRISQKAAALTPPPSSGAAAVAERSPPLERR